MKSKGYVLTRDKLTAGRCPLSGAGPSCRTIPDQWSSRGELAPVFVWHLNTHIQTGKTKTIVETILQILASNPCAHVLVCAPSNPAADTIARRLLRTLTREDMFRLNAANRTFAEVPDILLPYCWITDDTFGLPPFERLMEYKVVVCGLLDAGILTKAHASNGDLGRAVVDVMEMQKVRRPTDKVAVRPHWTHLLVDEVRCTNTAWTAGVLMETGGTSIRA